MEHVAGVVVIPTVVGVAVIVVVVAPAPELVVVVVVVVVAAGAVVVVAVVVATVVVAVVVDGIVVETLVVVVVVGTVVVATVVVVVVGTVTVVVVHTETATDSVVALNVGTATKHPLPVATTDLNTPVLLVNEATGYVPTPKFCRVRLAFTPRLRGPVTFKKELVVASVRFPVTPTDFEAKMIPSNVVLEISVAPTYTVPFTVAGRSPE